MNFRMFVLGAAVAGANAVAAPRGFTVEDLVAMERVGAPVLSPDASRILYTVRTTDLAKNRGHFEVWMVDLKAAQSTPRMITKDDASSTDPEWAPAGDAVYFLSARSGSNQVWRQPIAGGEAVRVTDLPVDVENFRIAPGGDRIALGLAVYRDCADLACTKARLDAKEKNKATGMVYDRLFVRHWDTWADGRTNVLYSAPLDANGRVSGAPVSLSGSIDGDVPSKPFGDHDDYRFSPDGKTLVFSVRVAGKTEAARDSPVSRPGGRAAVAGARRVWTTSMLVAVSAASSSAKKTSSGVRTEYSSRKSGPRASRSRAAAMA